MAKLGPYEVHPFADKFPLIEGDEFEGLVTDIKEHGLREPIVLNHDRTMLIDGRNRYRACQAAGCDVKLTTLAANYTDAMILDLIVSVNIERRHLNPGQRAMLALDYEAAYAEAAKLNQGTRTDLQPNFPADLRESSPRERESAERAAKAVGASGRGVQQAKAVQRDTPDLANRVRSGDMALDAADKQRRQWAKSQPKPEPVKPGPVPLMKDTHDGQKVPYPQPKGKAIFNDSPGDGISWAAWSWNPVTGCLHGCDYCYAREIATSDRYKPFYPAEFTPLRHLERLDAPRNTTIPEKYRDDSHTPCGEGDCKICAYRRVFVCSMADLYGRWVPDEWIGQVHASMLASPQWEYLLLTKFPSRYIGLNLPSTAWLGTSVDEQKRVRIAEDAFRQIDGVAVKWLSLEPLREPLEFTDLSMFNWVVIGAQTETRQPGKVVPAFAPPFEWVARIVAQAREAGCLIHCKPNLLGCTRPDRPGMQMPNEYPSPVRMRQEDLLAHKED